MPIDLNPAALEKAQAAIAAGFEHTLTVAGGEDGVAAAPMGRPVGDVLRQALPLHRFSACRGCGVDAWREGHSILVA